MGVAQTRWGVGENAEAIQAWDGPLFDRFVRFRHIVTTGLGAHGEEALRLAAPRPGQRVLDVGRGFGDTMQTIARLVGPDGEALGVDAAPRFIETARSEAQEDEVANARFALVDVETASFDERFDLAFSRFGTMFFANPVAALRNVREALVAGGQLAVVGWWRAVSGGWACGGGVSTTTGCPARRRSWRGSSRDRRSTTSRPAGRGRSRWPRRARRATSCSAPASWTARRAAATSRSSS